MNSDFFTIVSFFAPAVRTGFKTSDHARGQGNISSTLEARSSRLKGKDMIRTAFSFQLQAFSRSM
jgi:hypothetical protein